MSSPAFLWVALLVVITPGQDTLLTIRNTILGGRRAGISSALGVVTGQATWTFATAAGLSAVILASAPLFVAIKIVGAAYLGFLGVHTLWRAFHGRGREPRAGTAGRGGGLAARDAYRQGLLSNLGNPKIALFFTSLLPQFVPHDPSFADFIGLGSILWLYTLGWLTLYACAVAKAGDILDRPRLRRLLDAVTGACLLGLGVRIALESR